MTEDDTFVRGTEAPDVLKEVVIALAEALLLPFAPPLDSDAFVPRPFVIVALKLKAAIFELSSWLSPPEAPVVLLPWPE